MNSVLLSFSLSMFAVAQALTSLIHDCIECVSCDCLPLGHLRFIEKVIVIAEFKDQSSGGVCA